MWRNPRWCASSNAFQTASTPGYWSAYVFLIPPETKGMRRLPNRYRQNRQWFSLCISQRIFLPVVLWLTYCSCGGKIVGREISAYAGGINLVQHPWEIVYLFHGMCFLYSGSILESFFIWRIRDGLNRSSVFSILCSELRTRNQLTGK